MYMGRRIRLSHGYSGHDNRITPMLREILCTVHVCVCICVCIYSTCTCVLQIKGILQNRTQIEEWIEDKAIRRHQQHHRHKERSDSEEESSGEEEQETTKEKVANKKTKNDVKSFVYSYDLGWKHNLRSSSEWVVAEVELEL